MKPRSGLARGELVRRSGNFAARPNLRRLPHRTDVRPRSGWTIGRTTLAWRARVEGLVRPGPRVVGLERRSRSDGRGLRGRPGVREVQVVSAGLARKSDGPGSPGPSERVYARAYLMRILLGSAAATLGSLSVRIPS